MFKINEILEKLQKVIQESKKKKVSKFHRTHALVKTFHPHPPRGRLVQLWRKYDHTPGSKYTGRMLQQMRKKRTDDIKKQIDAGAPVINREYHKWYERFKERESL